MLEMILAVGIALVVALVGAAWVGWYLGAQGWDGW